MNNRREENLGNPNIWLSIDPKTVKQRVDRITAQLEKVLCQYESQVDAAASDQQKKD
ncbi:MAG: hypothetical protein U7123_01375 [Potamolinea sp.]